MSNLKNKKEATSEQIQMIKYLDFLGNKDFPSIIKQYNLNIDLENKLLTAHIVTIGFQSVGIKEGYAKLEYWQTVEKTYTTNYIPKISFAFRITTNGLIENNSSSSSGIAVRNTKNNYIEEHSYGRRVYYSASSFRQFLNKYIANIFPEVSSENHEYLESLGKINNNKNGITIKYNNDFIKDKYKKIENAYNKIILEHLEIFSFLQFHFLSQDILINEHQNDLSHTKKNKI